ncbi:Heavy metal-associated isoprenylated plant protein 41 [Vitis vinifera]|uniref:Heavy metal-associated isoprenylated plant protein 41 n=1 Tax=Vitis vinifera TaxID=29760 RepID=A0A438D4D2_VITVI|nr:Heavy metal-associated isoprenylated plant protein 41 [Vitis vinifera]
MEKNEEEEDQEIESFSSDDEEDKGGAEKCIKHYSSSQRILLVGEGDFSFSLSLAKAFGSGHNMVATSLDTQESLARKYSNGIENVRQLEARSCLVLHGVDATQMSQHFFLRTQRFDRIIYNFPMWVFSIKRIAIARSS